eukprot:1464789-Amphidinium_carterae.2
MPDILSMRMRRPPIPRSEGFCTMRCELVLKSPGRFRRLSWTNATAIFSLSSLLQKNTSWPVCLSGQGEHVEGDYREVIKQGGLLRSFFFFSSSSILPPSTSATPCSSRSVYT